jgi:inhibitor of cysteine peptidase
MKNIITALLLVCSLSANANSDLSMDVVNTATSFVVSLDANPTTGYQWSLVQFDKELVTLSSSQYQKPQTNLIGAGGKMLFTFTLNKGKTYPAKTKIVFKYARPWEHVSGAKTKVVVNFVSSAKQ